jgi:hypothetical protein
MKANIKHNFHQYKIYKIIVKKLKILKKSDFIIYNKINSDNNIN